jgi:hypothetical protein
MRGGEAEQDRASGEMGQCIVLQDVGVHLLAVHIELGCRSTRGDPRKEEGKEEIINSSWPARCSLSHDCDTQAEEGRTTGCGGAGKGGAQDRVARAEEVRTTGCGGTDGGGSTVVVQAEEGSTMSCSGANQGGEHDEL